ncbi:MAG: mechanosensitive ion channel [Candidatus Sulfobium sp.]|jgi:small-conductance mechanosensitive channel
MIPSAIKEFFPRADVYLILAALIVTVVYLAVRKIIPRILIRMSDKLHLDKGLTSNFSHYVLLFFGVLYIIFIADLILSIPVVSKYAEPVLAYPIVSVEALRLSLASLVKGIVGFYVLLVLTKILRSAIRMYLFYRSHGADVASTVDILVYNTAMVIIVMIALSIMGISWKVLLPVAGALGIGIGFGVRDIANNFVSGFVILTSRTIKRGDWVTMGDNAGKIVDIGIRTSTLRTVDNIDIIIPNAQLISNQLINWSYTDNIVRIHVPVGVSYGSDVSLVKETLLEVAKGSSDVLDYPPSEARFISFGNSSLDFELLVWIDVKKIRMPLVKSRINYLIWDAFKVKGIQIPFPQRDVWFKNELRIGREPVSPDNPAKDTDAGEPG